MRFRPPLLGLAVLAGLPRPLASQNALPPLQFLGFEAGARLGAVAQRVVELGGTGLRCDSAKTDRAVMECRGVLADSGVGATVQVWLSAMDSLSGILTLSAAVTGEQLDQWREYLEHHYGQVGARVQGSQWMMQWVRQGRMVRLTWRIQGMAKEASVSLVDGWVLDGWARKRMPPSGPT